ILVAARVGVWPGVDGSLRAHGHRRLAGLAGTGMGRGAAGPRALPRAVGAERAVDLALLRLADGWACLRGDYCALAVDRGDGPRVLERATAGGGAAAAVPGMGKLRLGAELGHLANESRSAWLTRRRRRAEAPRQGGSGACARRRC